MHPNVIHYSYAKDADGDSVEGLRVIDEDELSELLDNSSQLAALRKRVEELEGKAKAWDAVEEVFTRDGDGFCLDSLRDEINRQIEIFSKQEHEQ